MPDLPRPDGEKQQGASFVTHESMGRSLGSQKKVLGRVIGVEKRLGNAEKKITIMKNIMKMRKSSDNIGNTIKGIAESVDAIAETTTQQYDLEKDKAEDARISGEKSDAKKDEKNLEKGWGAFKGGVSKVLAPVGNMFKTLGDFIKKFVLAAGVMSLLEWFQNPENMGKIQSLFRFFKDWWPILLTGLILFVGTVLGPGALWIAGIVAVAAVIPTIVKGVKSIFGMGKGIDKELDSKKGDKLAQDGVDSVEKGAEKDTPIDMKESENKADEMKNLQEPQKFKEGGFVSGPAGEDKVPARLTAGEFVMSKGAVQQYGVDHLAGMNAAAGGTNRPTMGGYSQGGKVTMSQQLGHTRGTVTDPKEKKAQEDYMLEWVNKERVEFLGLPPLDKLTYADGVELTKEMGADLHRSKETSHTDYDFDNMIKTTSISKTVGDKSIFAGSIGLLTEEDKQQYLDSNPGARAMMEMKDQFELDALGADISASAKMNGGGLVPGFVGGGFIGKLPQVRAAKWLGGKAKNAMSFVRNKLQSPPPPPTSKSGAKYQINVPAVGGGGMVGAPQKTGSGIPAFSVVAGGGMAKEQTLGIRR